MMLSRRLPINISVGKVRRLHVLALGLIIEYTCLLLILFNQRRLALTVFCTDDKYPAIVYFELIFGGIYLLSNLAVLFAIKSKLVVKLSAKPQHVIYSATTLCAFSFMFLLLTPKLFFLRFSLLLLFMVIFLFLHIYEQLLTIFCLLNMIRTRVQYRSFANMFFMIVGVSIISAKAIHDATNYFVDLDLRVFFSFLPITVLGVITILLSRQFCFKINSYDIKRLSHVMRSLRYSWKEQLTRLTANLTIGAFMIEWYANTPNQNYIYSGWDARVSNLLLVVNNVIALLIVYFYNVFINQINKRIWLAIILLLFILCDFIIDLMPGGSYFVICSFFLMSILFNMIIKTINQLIHYQINDLKLYIFSLIWGSGVGIVFFCFLFDTLNLVVMHNTLIISDSVMSNITIGVVIVLCLFCISNIAKIDQKV
ncbi:MAG: hypothetical protein EKK54_02865 [Neisseriaceae bacterium]|nr:MAG: hypothetical protein EKK54_02865 [Neisseriaceae bacterium]